MKKQDAWAKAFKIGKQIDVLLEDLNQLCRTEGLEFSQVWEAKFPETETISGSAPSWDESNMTDMTDWYPSVC